MADGDHEEQRQQGILPPADGAASSSSSSSCTGRKTRAALEAMLQSAAVELCDAWEEEEEGGTICYNAKLRALVLRCSYCTLLAVGEVNETDKAGGGRGGGGERRDRFLRRAYRIVRIDALGMLARHWRRRGEAEGARGLPLLLDPTVWPYIAETLSIVAPLPTDPRMHDALVRRVLSPLAQFRGESGPAALVATMWRELADDDDEEEEGGNPADVPSVAAICTFGAKLVYCFNPCKETFWGLFDDIEALLPPDVAEECRAKLAALVAKVDELHFCRAPGGIKPAARG